MSLLSYTPTLEERIRNVVRVEEPLTVHEIARFIRDVRVSELDQVVWDMVRDGLLGRVWSGDVFEDFKFRI